MESGGGYPHNSWRCIIDTLKKILANGWEGDYQTEVTIARPRFQEVIDAIPGYTMATFNHMYLLNSLVRETHARVYLEIGVWVGHSLLAAAIDNYHCKCIGVEDLSRHPDVERLRQAEEIFPKNIDLVLLPFQTFFEKAEVALKKGVVDVYYYDADHTTQGTYDGLVMAQPYLSDKCYVVVDDTEMSSVRKGVDQFLRTHAWKEVLRIDGEKTKEDHPHPWYNGVTILRRNA